MGDYTTVDKVSAALNGLEITSSTVITSTMVEDWITEVESVIDSQSTRTLSSTLVTDEVVDYDGSGFLRLPSLPVLSVSTLSYNKYSVRDSNSEWTELTAGRGGDYLLHGDDGEIEFLTNVPSGVQRVRWTGIAGYDSVPGYISELATLMAAKRYIEAVVGGSSSSEGGSVSVGNISVQDPTTFGIDNLSRIDDSISRLWKMIPSGVTPLRSRNYSWNRYY